MSAMEKMLMNMLGVDATQLSEMAGNLSSMIKKIADNMEAINKTQIEIIERLERIENGNRNNSDGNASPGIDGNGGD